MPASQLRLAAITLLVAGAAVSALSVKLAGKVCTPCATASYSTPVPRLEIIGAVFYVVLAIALWKWNLNKFTLAALFLAAGCHVDLLYKLAKMHLACIPCIACAVMIIAAAILSRTYATITVQAVALCGIVLMHGLFARQQQVEARRIEKAARDFLKVDQMPLTAGERLPVYIFQRRGCHSCREFDQLVLPQLKLSYGTRIELHITEVPSAECPVPTIVIGGKKPAVKVGQTNWQQINSMVKPALAEWERTGKHKPSAEKLAGKGQAK